jgi:hypothetical protein
MGQPFSVLDVTTFGAAGLQVRGGVIRTDLCKMVLFQLGINVKNM